ncbi:MAG: hypothetical protein IPH08_10535 [Rhodocyclaceae bacterium]|nr:hypothetical protein [Rhodocyclaceae bacterium]
MIDMNRADQLAECFISAWDDFDKALSANKRRYPSKEFDKMFVSFDAYIIERRGAAHIHRKVGAIVQTAHEYIVCERKKVPQKVHKYSWRMSYMLFDDHDPLEELEDALHD